jgi:hypothetical protein
MLRVSFAQTANFMPANLLTQAPVLFFLENWLPVQAGVMLTSKKLNSLLYTLRVVTPSQLQCKKAATGSLLQLF